MKKANGVTWAAAFAAGTAAMKATKETMKCLIPDTLTNRIGILFVGAIVGMKVTMYTKDLINTVCDISNDVKNVINEEADTFVEQVKEKVSDNTEGEETDNGNC